MKRILAAILIALLLGACTGPPPAGSQAPDAPVDSAAPAASSAY